jgi:hypothetical protein
VHATRLAVGALVVFALTSTVNLVGHAAPAVAVSRICAPQGHGCASFWRDRNTFDVCDYAWDGYAVAVQRSDGKIIAVNYWGSLKYNGCRRWHVKGRPYGARFRWRVCLANNAKPGGKPIRIVKYWCSGYRTDRYEGGYI